MKKTLLEELAEEIGEMSGGMLAAYVPPCGTCGEPAVWSYAPREGYYCAECVPRGCDAWPPGEEYDVDGRLMPCVEYDWIGPAQ